MGEELNVIKLIGDDGGDWMPLDSWKIETYNPFKEVIYAPIRTLSEGPEVTIEFNVTAIEKSVFMLKSRRILFGWKAKGPMRQRNLWKAARLRGRR